MPLAATHTGDNLFYLQRGASGPALICLHGAGGTHAHWGYQLRDLSENAQVYTLDLPGHGRSAPPGRTRIADYSAALLAFMDAQNLDRAVLAGHSMGGAIALRTALDAPDRVAGLALVGTGGRLRVAPAILDGFNHDLEATIRLIVDYSYAAPAPAKLLAQAEAAFAEGDPAVFQGDFAACDAFDVLARLPEITCPTAIICGDEDRLTPPKYSVTMRDRIPGATLTLVSRAGHMVMVEQPDAVNEALRALLKRKVG